MRKKIAWLFGKNSRGERNILIALSYAFLAFLLGVLLLGPFIELYYEQKGRSQCEQEAKTKCERAWVPVREE